MIIHTLAILIIVSNYGFATNEQQQIQDDVFDLKRLNPLPTKQSASNSAKVSEVNLDEGASAIQNSVTPGVYSNFDGNFKPSNKRLVSTRFDNAFYNGLNNNQASSGQKLDQFINFNQLLNNQSPDQVMNTNQNHYRKLKLKKAQANPWNARMRQERRQHPQNRAYLSNVEESRKRQMKPTVRPAKSSFGSSTNKADDIFDDDEVPARRNDESSQDDDNSNDDDGDEEDQEQSSGEGRMRNPKSGGRGRSDYRKVKAASQHFNRKEKVDPDEEREDSSSGADDEDVDSSNKMDSLTKSLVDSGPPKGDSRVDSNGEPESNPMPDNNDPSYSASHVKRSSADLQTAAGHHHGHHDHYYQYVEVPKKKAWKFGFKRGNHKHTIERHEKGHKHKFHSEFKWHAKEKCKKKKKCKSVGKMTWDYKHDKKHHG